MASRPRSSLASGSSGLPTPGGSSGVTARRKSGLPSPGNSPSKSSKRASQTDDIAARMSELQAAIRSKDPASYSGLPGRHSALGTIDNDEEMEMLKPISAQSPPEFASPRPIRRVPSTASALRPTPQSTLRSHAQAGTPTSTPGPAASFVRPGSSLSSSTYMSAHLSSDAARSISPLLTEMPVTPAKRSSETLGLTPSSARLVRTASNVSSTSSFATAPSSVYNDTNDGSRSENRPQIGDNVKVANMEGVLEYIGPVQGKPGTYAGVRLVGKFVNEGKNDGTVQGVRYFECDPKYPTSGIFALLSKVEALMPPPSLFPISPVGAANRVSSRPSSSLSSVGPTPRKLPRASGSLVPPSTVARNAAKSSTDASQYASSQITAGSRASSYLNLTAKQLQERKEQAGPSASSVVTRSPRKSSVFSSSTMSAVSTGGPTPKPARTARPSIGGTAPPSYSARRSIGGPATPGAASAIRRPPSSLRSHTPDVPSVPPIPAGLNSAAPAATPAKRYAGISRPTTPSGSARPSSRLSNAGSVSRSVSRASSRASMLSGSSRLSHRNDDAEEEVLKDLDSVSPQELQNAKDALNKATREAEQAKLELLELTGDYRDEQKKTKALQVEVDELKRKAADSRLDQASAIDERQAEKEQREAELVKLRQDLADLQKHLVDISESKQGLTAELQQGHEVLARVQEERDASAKEAKSLAHQLDELQKAGRAMVDLYEDKFHNLEDEFQNTQEALIAREEQLRSVQEEVERQQALIAKREHREANGTDAFLAASLSASRRGEQEESALAIENDNLRAELEHVKKRLATLDEQLYDSRAEFEIQLDKEKQKRQDGTEAVEKLKTDLKEYKERMEKIKLEKEKSEQRAHELEVALKEARQTLENERAELESLRNEQQDHNSSSQGRNDELAHLRSALTVAQHDKKDKEKEIKKLQADIESLQEELKLMEEIREEIKADVSVDEAREVGNGRYKEQLRARDETILQLQQELLQASRRDLPRISTEPTNTDTTPTPIQSSFGSYPNTTSGGADDHHLSPHDNAKHSPSSSTSSSRRKRDSNTSVHSTTSNSSLTSLGSNYRRASLKDESSMMKDEIEGLKILLKQAEGEIATLKQKIEHSLANAAPKTSSHELLEAEVKELKETIRRLEKEHKKEKDNLNSEVMQLELLVEAKIFKEGELESQLEDLKRALSDHKKSALSLLGNNGLPNPPASSSSTGHNVAETPRKSKSTLKAVRSSTASGASIISNQSEHGPESGRRSASQYSEEDLDDGLCEICKGDHAVENCPIFGGSSASDTESTKDSKKNSKPNGVGDAPYCDDCEEYDEIF